MGTGDEMVEQGSDWAGVARGSDAQASERQFQRLLEHLPAGAYICDAQGLITYFNPSAADLWGRRPVLHDPRDRYCGSHELYTPAGERVAHDQCWMARALREDAGFNGREIVVMRPDGTRRTVLAHANPYHDENGALLGAVNVLVEVAAATPQPPSAVDLDAHRLQTLGALAGGVAHELNNVLTIMLGCAELVRRDVARPDAVARVLAHVDEIQDAGARAKGLLHQLLSFGRRSGADKQRVQLSQVVEHAVLLMRNSVGRELVLDTQLDARAPLVSAHTAQLQQVIVNLCTQAAQRMRGQRGRVLIKVEHSVQATREGVRAAQWVRLSVSDDGPGIPHEVLGRVFEPSFTLHDALPLGVGLAVVQHIVASHGGRVEVQSQVGQGTTFTVYLPAATG